MFFFKEFFFQNAHVRPGNKLRVRGYAWFQDGGLYKGTKVLLIVLLIIC